MVVDRWDYGGVTKVVHDLASGLVDRGHQVTIACCVMEKSSLGHPAGVDIHILSQGNSRWAPFSYAWRLWLILKERQIDVVHTHQRGVSLWAHIASILMGRIPVIEHVHNQFKRNLLTVLSFRSKVLIACSGDIATMLTDDFHRNPQRVVILRNAVPAQQQSPRVMVKERPSHPLPRVLTVARMEAQKDPYKWLAIAKSLNSSAVRANFTWVGDGDLLPRIRNAVTSEGIQGVTLAGYDPDTLKYYHQADLLLLTSEWEGLPLALLEAASHGVALMAPDVGGCHEIVRNGVTGCLFNARAAPEIVATMLMELVTSPSFAKLGRNAQNIMQDEFDFERNLQRLEGLYVNAIRA